MTTNSPSISRFIPMAPARVNLHLQVAFALAGAFSVVPLHAADVTVQPSAGSGFVIKDTSGANERLRVQESGAVSLPGLAAAPTQAQGVCVSPTGQLGPCSGVGSGSTYAASTGLALAGTTFSVAPTYQLPQTCAANQFAQWNGTAWACANAGAAALPPGVVNETVRYDANNVLVANGLLLAFSDGGLWAGGTLGTGSIPTSGTGARMMWYPAKAAFRAGWVNTNVWDDANVGQYSVALGENTSASGSHAVALGAGSSAAGFYSTAMGYLTQATGYGSTAIGSNNVASGPNAFAAGMSSQASGRAAAAIGEQVVADGNDSIAMGNGASTMGHGGSFIFHDFCLSAPCAPYTNTADNQFMVAASGGIVFWSGPSSAVSVPPGGGSWTTTSDRNVKTALGDVDPREVLKKVAALPMNTWQYKTQDAKYRHLGPMAQDFYAAFHLGESDKGIDTVDSEGVSLAAIQGLNALLTELDAKANARIDEKDREIAALRAELTTQKTRVAALESLAGDLAQMKAQIAALRQPSPEAVALAARRP